MCSAAKHVPEIAKGFHESREFKELPTRISEIKKDLKNARQSLHDNKKAIEKSGDQECLQQIHTLRQQFNAIFDRLEQRTVSEIENRKSSVEGKIQTDIDRIDDVTERLQKLSDDLKDGGENNEATSYIGFAKCDDEVWKANVLLQDINKKDEYKLSFQPNKSITAFLSSLQMLGEVICEGGAKPLPGPDCVFKVEKHALHNVKVADDKDICNISGMCNLATGEFLVADTRNCKLKLLNSNYEVISTCAVLKYPKDVCLTGEREVAVAVDNYGDVKGRHEIHFFRVRSGTLLKARTIKLKHRCIGLAHSNGYLYITANTGLHVYSILSGQRKKLYSDKTGLYTVVKCAVSPGGSRIYITNNDQSQLVILNRDDIKLSTLTLPRLKYPVEVHVTSLHHVFVCFCHLVQTVTINEGKQIVTPLAGDEEGLTEPTALCFNSSTNTLVVGQYCNDNIVALQMKH